MSRHVTPSVVILAALLLAGCSTVAPLPFSPPSGAGTLPVAMVSMQCDPDPSINRERMAGCIVQIMAERPGVRLICFGEAATGWYLRFPRPAAYQRSVAEPLEGPTVSLMRALAARHRVHVLFGFIEQAGTRTFNSAVIIDDTGEVIAHRRKSDLVPMDRWNGCTPGERTLTTVRIDGVKAVLLICNDFNNRSLRARALADPEIRMLLLPHATANLAPDFWRRYRYGYRGLWMLSAQRCGVEGRARYFGSWILDPNGCMAMAAESCPGYFVCELPVR